MKLRFILCLILTFCLGSLSQTIPKSNLLDTSESLNEKGLESQEKTIQVLGESKTIRVLYKPEGIKSQFAKLVLETSAAYIPKVAEYLNVAPKGKVLTIKDLTDGTTARNEGAIIYLPFAFPDPELPIQAPLLYHEIGHWWFGQDPRWISEGVSSFLPIAMAMGGNLDLNQLEIHKIKSWWGFFNPLPKNDSPLGDKAKGIENIITNFPLYYEKSFKIQYLLFLELGTEGYRNFLVSLMNPNHETWHDYFIAPSQAILDHQSKGVFTLLKIQKDFKWENFLSGWVLQSGYQMDTRSILKDSDGDSLVDFEEFKIGTNPKEWDSDKDGLGDYAELTLGTSPIEANDRDYLQSKIRNHGIIFDGLKDDWDFIETKPILLRNHKNQKVLDVEFRFFQKDKILYGMLASAKPFMEIFLEEKDLYFFFADNSKQKERIGFGFKMNPNDAYGWEFERTKGKKRYVFGKVGTVFEFQIDASGHPDPELVLIPLINGKTGPSVWHWDYDHPILIPLEH
ncbi:hypothetical protein LEP1GSC202_2815 [Leptospira yanagawae serovar Saopaulo str. Sao Paulo = ATCC 700523]|uniref:Peptidase MA family protein n=1 Tax=Leptospira yanagawae serovar Saopaulo str. Sao Paulo = ATCC 700523 TaxID=1249483 RepID=A0A5E8HDR3_9LEPT|nr:hypothetical protein [Leptospira yanagawae]EOQ88630.1 hypothetical protein LEP1GSC202_2815 [Leptospira yanagawae serovar Saopaulo str. Sao Paulo = ATCC 700523]